MSKRLEMLEAMIANVEGDFLVAGPGAGGHREKGEESG